MFVQERYGRFTLNDPFLALQRDYEAGAGDKEKPVCTNPLSILEAVMGHCRKMQERMSAQLAAAESRQKKVLRLSNGLFPLYSVEDRNYLRDYPLFLNIVFSGRVGIST